MAARSERLSSVCAQALEEWTEVCRDFFAPEVQDGSDAYDEVSQIRSSDLYSVESAE